MIEEIGPQIASCAFGRNGRSRRSYSQTGRYINTSMSEESHYWLRRNSATAAPLRE